MIGQIVTHTPIWVWLLLAGLCFVGFQQTKTRQVTRRRLLILPLAMLGLSIMSLQNSFGFQITVIEAWLGGLLVSAWLTMHLIPSMGGSDDAPTSLITVQGSWLPMMLILAMFITRYVLNAGLTVKPELAQTSGFSVGIAIAFGLINGAFLGRVFGLIFMRQKPMHLPA